MLPEILGDRKKAKKDFKRAAKQLPGEVLAVLKEANLETDSIEGQLKKLKEKQLSKAAKPKLLELVPK